MIEDRKVAWAVAAGIALFLIALLFSEKVQRELRPELVGAHVGIEIEGSGVARVGTVEVTAGTAATLHAVLEGRKRSGEAIYYSEASAIELDGKRVEESSIEPWPGPEEVRILWFSVEGPRPLVELRGEDGLERVRFQEVYRSDWPRGWSIPASLKPARANWTAEVRALRGDPFGTQRYQVRVELFGQASQLVPLASFDSAGVDEVITLGRAFPTLVATLPERLALASRVFGLTQVRWGDSPPEAAVTVLQSWFESDLAYSRVLLLRRMLDRAGARLESLEWTAVDLAAGPDWNPDGEQGAVGPGDLLRAGDRVVVLFEDRGTAGRLDLDDLCFDFEDGADVVRLGEIFSGEGLVEHAALQPSAARTGEEDV